MTMSSRCVSMVAATWIITSVAAFQACTSSQAQRSAVTVADIVNEVSRRGDQAYGLSVESCNAAEKAAAQAPDLEHAKMLVQRIRTECDRAFALFEDVRMVVSRIDQAVADAEAGKVTPEQLVALALEARRRFEVADSTAQWVSQMLEGLK